MTQGETSSMSTPQRTHARVPLTVARNTADVLRLEAKKVLMFGHELFEDYLDFGPEAQYALAMRFQDAIDLITAVGWDPDTNAAQAETFEVGLTDDLIKQLARRRIDLGATNSDRLDGLDDNEPISADLLAEITADRNAAAELDRLIGAYTVAIARTRR
jgi:hypothetical protein